MEKGVTKFMRKLNIGYSKYFNIKHERTGALFEGRYKCILIKDEAHFIHLPYYIHLNPLDFKFPEWRIRKLRNYKAAMDFLNSYKWSSHPDYLGEKNFPSVTNRKFLSNFFEEAGGYEKNISQWIKNLDLTNKKELLLE
jgi:putative transposase